jgi:hypothetical protein
MQPITFEEYTFIGFGGTIYHPRLLDDRWYLVGTDPLLLRDIVFLCNIPREDAIILKLKYRG